MSYKIRQEGSQQIQVHGKWVDIPGTAESGEQEISGCRISNILNESITTSEQFDQLIRNCMGLDDDPEHAEFIRKLGAKLTPASERENCPTAPQPFAVGDNVRVHSSISNPKHGWGHVNHESVGEVTSVNPNGSMHIDFPEQTCWNGFAPEMERVVNA